MHLVDFLSIFNKGDNFWTSCLISCTLTPFWKGVCLNITETCLYNVEPLKPHLLYVVKLGFTLFFLFLLKTDCGYSLGLPRRGGSNEYPQSMFWAEIWKNIRMLIWKFSFFGGKLSVYLNRLVFVMKKRVYSQVEQNCPFWSNSNIRKRKKKHFDGVVSLESESIPLKWIMASSQCKVLMK